MTLKQLTEEIIKDLMSRGITVGSPDEVRGDIIHVITSRVAHETIEAVKVEEKDEVGFESCANCGEQAYGKAWYGRGVATHDTWGNRYYPTGSAAFCKECAPQFAIGKEWDGEEIWKTTSDRPEYSHIREGSIKFTDKTAVGHNSALKEIEDKSKHFLEA